MRTAILMLNFGEPEHPVLDEVVPFLQRIFSINDSLEERSGAGGRERARQLAQARARQLAQARAPGLIEEYERIGGSPLHAQADEQAVLLEAELTRRGHDVTCILGMQFTRPFISDAVRRARAAGVQQIVALPVYPLCGRSTTVAALERLRADLGQQLWAVPVREISGWHRHPDYLRFRADCIRTHMLRNALSFDDRGTKLVFSAHGTPMKYLREGSRYDAYVRDFCAEVGRLLGVSDYAIGYQNHTNRPIDWTQPDVQSVIASIDAQRVVVDPVSFVHEQSETLAELDHELKEEATSRGLEFHRVPIAHDSHAFIGFLADLTTPFLDNAAAAPGRAPGSDREWGSCRCSPGAYCLNATVEQQTS